MVLLWCLETAPLNAEQRKALDRAQVGMVAQMAHVKRRWRDDELWRTWAKRKIDVVDTSLSITRLLCLIVCWQNASIGVAMSAVFTMTGGQTFALLGWDVVGRERGRYDGNWAAYKPEYRWKSML